MIELRSLAQLRNGEFIQLVDNLLTIIRDRQAGSLKVQDQFTAREDSYDSLTDSYTVNRKNDLSQKLAEIDKKRDLLYLGLKSLIDGHSVYSPNEQHKDLAISILNILKSHGSELVKMACSEQTAALTDVIDQLKSKELDYHIKHTFHAAVYYDALITANERFDRVYVDRIKDYGTQDKENVKELRTVVEDAFNEMVQRINAYIVLEPSAHFIDASGEINAALELYFNNLKKRSSSTDNSDDSEDAIG